MLVGDAHGAIEAHFSFFVMIAVIALYEDWVPFGVALGFVVAEHGIAGAIVPLSVYAEQLARLRAMGGQMGQGFHFARPLPADEVLPALARGTCLPLAVAGEMPAAA